MNDWSFNLNNHSEGYNHKLNLNHDARFQISELKFWKKKMETDVFNLYQQQDVTNNHLSSLINLLVEQNNKIDNLITTIKSGNDILISSLKDIKIETHSNPSFQLPPPPPPPSLLNFTPPPPPPPPPPSIRQNNNENKVSAFKSTSSIPNTSGMSIQEKMIAELKEKIKKRMVT